MDFFQHRYYRLSKMFMTLCGSWPHQSARTRCNIFIFLVIVLCSQIVPQILALVKYRNKWEVVIQCIIAFLFEAICVTKYIACMLNLGRIMKLLNRIRTDWQMWARDPELNILHEYADQGRKMSLTFTDLSTLHTAEIYSVAFIYVAQPTIPKIIDVLLKNGTAAGEFPFPVDYYHLDKQKYYVYLIMHNCVCLFIGSITFVASENMLFICVQHVCGVLVALGCKLQRIVNSTISIQSEGTSYALDKRILMDFASWIERHNDAIDCAKLIEATYTWHLFHIIGIGMFNLLLIGLQILLGKSNPEVTIRFICFALASIFHLFIDCYISQILMNNSISIHLYIYDSQWYKLARKSQNLLQLMMMRCCVPCQLTAGKLFTLSMRTFGQTMRTSMSYFTVLRSMQT